MNSSFFAVQALLKKKNILIRSFSDWYNKILFDYLKKSVFIARFLYDVLQLVLFRTKITCTS